MRRAETHSNIPQASAFAALLMLLAGVFLAPQAASADPLYVVRGSRGVVTFTSRKPAVGSYSLFVPRGPSFSKFYQLRSDWKPRAIPSQFDDLIISMAELYDLEPALVKAVVHVESAFDPRARSPKGAMGLMQLMPGTAQRFGVSKPYKPEENVRGGVTYLKWLHDRYAGNMRLVLAAYNAGEGRVDKTREVPLIRETQMYVKRVMRMRELYTCAFNGKSSC